MQKSTVLKKKLSIKFLTCADTKNKWQLIDTKVPSLVAVTIKNSAKKPMHLGKIYSFIVLKWKKKKLFLTSKWCNLFSV